MVEKVSKVKVLDRMTEMTISISPPPPSMNYHEIDWANAI